MNMTLPQLKFRGVDLKQIRMSKKTAIKAIVGLLIASAAVYVFINRRNPQAIPFLRKDSAEYISQGDKYLATRHYQSARENYQQALLVDSTNPQPYLKIAEIYSLKNQHENALDIIIQGLGRATVKTDLNLQAGYLELLLGNPEKAREYLFLADTTNAKTHLYLGQTYLQQNNLVAAEKELDTYTNVYRSDPEGLYYLSVAVSLSNLTKAVDKITFPATQKWDRQPEALNFQTILLEAASAKNDLFKTTLICHGILTAGFPLVVIDPLKSVLSKDTQYRDALLELGTAYFYLNRSNEALSMFDAAYSSDPNFAETSFLMGKYYEYEKNYTAAEQYLSQAVTINPLNQTYGKELALFYERRSMYQRAIAQWETVILHEQNEGEKITEQLRLAFLYLDHSDNSAEGVELATDLYDSLSAGNVPLALLELQPQVADVYYWSQRASGRVGDALKNYQALIETSPFEALFWYHKGRVEQRAGKTKDAQESLSRATDLDLTGEIAKLVTAAQ